MGRLLSVMFVVGGGYFFALTVATIFLTTTPITPEECFYYAVKSMVGGAVFGLGTYGLVLDRK